MDGRQKNTVTRRKNSLMQHWKFKPHSPENLLDVTVNGGTLRRHSEPPPLHSYVTHWKYDTKNANSVPIFNDPTHAKDSIEKMTVRRHSSPATPSHPTPKKLFHPYSVDYVAYENSMDISKKNFATKGNSAANSEARLFLEPQLTDSRTQKSAVNRIAETGHHHIQTKETDSDLPKIQNLTLNLNPTPFTSPLQLAEFSQAHPNQPFALFSYAPTHSPQPHALAHPPQKWFSAEIDMLQAHQLPPMNDNNIEQQMRLPSLHMLLSRAPPN